MGRLSDLLGLTTREPAKTAAPVPAVTLESKLDVLLRAGADVELVAKACREMNLRADAVLLIERCLPRLAELRAFGAHVASVRKIEEIILSLPHNTERREAEAARERAQALLREIPPPYTPWENGAAITDPVRRAEFEKEKAAEKKKRDDEQAAHYALNVKTESENRKNTLRALQGWA